MENIPRTDTFRNHKFIPANSAPMNLFAFCAKWTFRSVELLLTQPQTPGGYTDRPKEAASSWPQARWGLLRFNFYFEVIIDTESWKDITERSCIPSAQPPPMITSSVTSLMANPGLRHGHIMCVVLSTWYFNWRSYQSADGIQTQMSRAGRQTRTMSYANQA